MYGGALTPESAIGVERFNDIRTVLSVRHVMFTCSTFRHVQSVRFDSSPPIEIKVTL